VSVVVLILTALSAQGCSEQSPSPDAAMPVDRESVADAGSRDDALHRSATRVEVGFEVPGTLAEFSVMEGQPVAQGTVIARLDPSDYQADLDAALEIAAGARAERDRRVRLFEDDVISKPELDRGERIYQAAVATVKLRQRALDDTVLRSPFDGVVARKIVRDFENVRAKQAIVELRKSGARRSRPAG
jgi:RND family efflux transporter MFP subunit